MSLLAEVNANGFALLRAQHESEDGLAALSRLGTIVDVEGASGKVQELRPRLRSESPDNIYSGNFGFDEFPLHTDLAHWHTPPRYVALRCDVGRSDVATLALDGNDLVAAIGDLRLRRTLSQARRPMRGTRPLMPLLGKRDSRELLRWDSLFLVAANSESEKTFSAIRDWLASVRPMEMFLIDRGDVIVLDNWRMLHGRAAVPETAVGRRIERAYLGDLH